jgi:quercetin dioxygenase-like cupin family protein
MRTLSKLAMLRTALIGAVALSGAALADLIVDEKGFATLKPGQEVWVDAPGYAGIQVMVVEGNPREPGPYVVRVKFSPGTMSTPHYHPDDRLITVIKGTWWTGKGERFDPAGTEPLPSGSFMKHPATAAHYDGAKDEEVIVQIIGVGPSDTVFFKPELGKTGKSR